MNFYGLPEYADCIFDSYATGNPIHRLTVYSFIDEKFIQGAEIPQRIFTIQT